MAPARDMAGIWHPQGAWHQRERRDRVHRHRIAGIWHPQGAWHPQVENVTPGSTVYSRGYGIRKEHGTRKGCHYYTTLTRPLIEYSSGRACPCHAHLLPAMLTTPCHAHYSLPCSPTPCHAHLLPVMPTCSCYAKNVPQPLDYLFMLAFRRLAD